MKKFNLIKRAISGALLCVMVTSLVGCSGTTSVVEIEPMKEETPASYGLDALGGDDVMPIMGFYAMEVSEQSWNANELPDNYTDERFALIKESGVNLINPIIGNYATVPQYTIKMLELASKYDLGILVMDTRILDPELSVEQVDSYINDYSNYKSFAGVYMDDEPGAPYFRDHENGTNIDEMTEIAANLNELGYFFYGNLLGMQGVATYSESDVATYYRYVSEWADTVHPKVLMYDRYIFGNNNGLDLAKTYFKTMETNRRVAEEHDIPFWVYIECGNQWNDAKNRFDSTDYYPSQGEFYWNVGTTLAFGAKGIMYFPLIQPSYFGYAETELFDFQRNGLIGAWGNKTRWFHYAKAMNAQIAAVDEILMNSVNKGVIASGETAKEDLSDCMYLMEGTSWRELVGVTGDAMIGCFNYQGKTALYVVNYDTEYAQKINLDFADTYNITVIQDAETSRVSCDNLELTFQAGGSALVVFE